MRTINAHVNSHFINVRWLRRMAGTMIVAAAFFAGSCAVADEVSSIVRAWRDLQEESRTIHYVMDGTSFTAKGALKRDEASRPSEDVTNPVRLEWAIDFPNQRFHRTQSFPYYDVTREQYVPRVSTFVFSDGKGAEFVPVISRDSKSKQTSDPQVEYYKSTQNTLLEWDLIVLLAHGYAPIDSRMPCSDLGRSPDANGLTIVGQAVDDHVSDPVVVLRTSAVEGMPQTFSEYWVAPSYEYRVVRVLRYEVGKVTREYAIEYVAGDDGMHLSNAEITSLLGAGQLVSENLQLKTVSFSSGTLPSRAFVLEPEPHMWVYDFAKQRSYVHEPIRSRGVLFWVAMGIAGGLVAGIAWLSYHRLVRPRFLLNQGDR